jgi:hypothetical protein
MVAGNARRSDGEMADPENSCPQLVGQLTPAGRGVVIGPERHNVFEHIWPAQECFKANIVKDKLNIRAPVDAAPVVNLVAPQGPSEYFSGFFASRHNALRQ